MSYRDDVYTWLDEHHAEVEHLGFKEQAQSIIDDGATGAAIRTARRHISNWWDARDDVPDSGKRNEGVKLDATPPKPKAPKPSESKLNQLERDYYYNETGDVYVLQLNHRPKSVVLGGQTVRDMKEAYSRWTGDESTINEICRTFEISRRDFVAIKKALGWTHDSAPYTDEQLVTADIGDLKRDLARKQERELERQWQKEQWSRIEKDASKWREFSRDVLAPMLDGVRTAPIHATPYRLDRPAEPIIGVLNPTDGHLDQQNADGTGFERNREEWLGAHGRVLADMELYRPELLDLTLGNDMFNVDNDNATTTAGTPQDNDLLPSRRFKPVAMAGIEAIEMARTVAPRVRVRVVPGNHDYDTCQGYLFALECKYEGLDDVEIVGDCSPYQYARYGANLLGWHHGHGIKGGKSSKALKLGSLMASNVPRMWGESLHRYWFLGHLEHLWEDDQGVHVMQAMTTKAPDRYHELGGYTTSARGQCGWLFRKNGGQCSRIMALVA